MPAEHIRESRVALTRFAGRAGDHNDRAMIGSKYVAAALSTRFGVDTIDVGAPQPALSTNWDGELAEALPELQLMSARFEDVFGRSHSPVTALSRCAVALSTLPVVAAHRPDAVVVWFDAHADLNTPDSTETGYLGGLAFSGPLGWWDSGLGSGVSVDNAVLVGVRDVDASEQVIIAERGIPWVKVGPNAADKLRGVVAGRPVYIHIDCDVLEPGIVLTDYLVPDGFTLDDMRRAAEALAHSEVVGIEIGEFEARTDGVGASESAERLVEAMGPVLDRLA